MKTPKVSDQQSSILSVDCEKGLYGLTLLPTAAKDFLADAKSAVCSPHGAQHGHHMAYKVLLMS